MFGIPAIEAPAADSQPVAAADSGAPAELPRRSRTGTMFGIPAVGSLVPGEPPRRSRTGTKFGIPAVGPQVAEPEASDAAAETNAPAFDSAPETTDDAPRRVRTGTKFGLGPVSNADVEAAALVAQLQREHGAAPEPRAPSGKHGPQPASAAPRARRARYISTPKALVESPRLLLWAAGGLAALIVLLRLVLGPAERSRSHSVAMDVPDETTTELPTSAQAVAEIAEYALIGGDIPRAPLTAAAKPPPPAAPTQQPPAAAAEPAAEPDSDDQAAAAGKRVPTVSAVSVRGGLARAASTRPAAVSSKPAASSNAAPLDPKLQARELYKAGKYREAADAYQRATQLDATDAGAFAGLGGSLMATGDFHKAIAAYQRAVRLQPEKSGFQAALGRAYLKKGDRARARAAYSKALELDPNNQAARSGMASAKAR
jgi:Flp pilus assembly protein TadD